MQFLGHIADFFRISRNSPPVDQLAEEGHVAAPARVLFVCRQSFTRSHQGAILTVARSRGPQGGRYVAAVLSSIMTTTRKLLLIY